MNVAKGFIVGRLAADPMLKSYKREGRDPGHRCFFRVAVTTEMTRGRPQGEQETSWIPVVSWGAAAVNHAQYLEKGTEVTVFGEIRCTSQKKDDGSYGPDNFYINASDIQYGRRSSKNNAGGDAKITGTKPAEVNLEQIQQLLGQLSVLQEAAKAAQGASAPEPESAPVTEPAAQTAEVGKAANPFLDPKNA